MNKIKNNKKYFLYSSLSHDIKKVYYNEIYRFLNRLVVEYSGFRDWYQKLFLSTYELNKNREIIICENQLRIAGVAIVKNDGNEKKICTLRVAKDCQRQGIGHTLVEMSFGYLNTEKPMITLHKNKLRQFEKILCDYNFELEQTQKHYYNMFSTELVYNGKLPQKEFVFSRIELFDMEEIYRSFVECGKKNLEEYVDACIRRLCQIERIRRNRIIDY